YYGDGKDGGKTLTELEEEAAELEKKIDDVFSLLKTKRDNNGLDSDKEFESLLNGINSLNSEYGNLKNNLEVVLDDLDTISDEKSKEDKKKEEYKIYISGCKAIENSANQFLQECYEFIDEKGKKAIDLLNQEKTKLLQEEKNKLLQEKTKSLNEISGRIDANINSVIKKFESLKGEVETEQKNQKKDKGNNPEDKNLDQYLSSKIEECADLIAKLGKHGNDVNS